ncbi:hypothetical protein [Roseibium aggregatum]|uniref:Uncharacterized protein n=1 Tax=Roseibium aggregatum TaxID=187304 RepID=A0A939EF53_9HYPH|nr:hypothetical protein [Roseibium aggregatum]MBN9672106.1 hypothetical protein [Roseibium aggregatum]
MKPILIEIGPGELCDRLSILALKVKHSRPGQQADLFDTALNRLRSLRDELAFCPSTIDLETELADVNRQLWDIEDALHDAEERRLFGPDYIDLARKVQKLNNRRCSLKAAIDVALEAPRSVEEKIYGQ